jgi:hypothetical protein
MVLGDGAIPTGLSVLVSQCSTATLLKLKHLKIPQRIRDFTHYVSNGIRLGTSHVPGQITRD